MIGSDSLEFGIIIGNRGFFPAALCEQGRKDILSALDTQGHRGILLSEEQSVYGSVESLEEARMCAELLDGHRHTIAGIIVTPVSYTHLTLPTN